MSKRKASRKERIDYRASWAPIIAAANEAVRRASEAGTPITRTTAFGVVEVAWFSFSEVTGVMYHVDSGFNAASYVADLHWVESVAGFPMTKVVR